MKILVCVTSQKSCERLIDKGKEMIISEQDQLSIVHIAHYEFTVMGRSEEGEALEYLYKKALSSGANLTVIRSNDIIRTLVDYVDENDIDYVIIGKNKELMINGDIETKLTDAFSEKVTIQVIS